MLKRINPPELFDGSVYGMSQGTIDETTGLVFLSGQVAWDENLQVRGQGYEQQTDIALENVCKALAASGASVEGIIHMRIYLRGEFADHAEKVAPRIAGFLNDVRPAVTGIGVHSLATPDTLIEIEVVARRNDALRVHDTTPA